jgi:methionyl-tRNA formyltransferase
MNVVLFAWCPSSLAYVDALVAAGTPPRLVVTGTTCSAAAPLAARCAELGLPVERRDAVNDPAFVDRLRALPIDLLLVAGCARLLGPALLAAPRSGALNFHPSRLPRYRGREPLFWALLHGEPSVAITVHHLRAEIDAGPILFQRDIPVPPRATSASLAALVDQQGAALVPEILAFAAAGPLPPGALAEGAGSHFPPLRAEHGLLDFSRSAAELERLIRACQGEIAACCFFQGLRLVVVEGEAETATMDPIVPGTVTMVNEDGLWIGTSSGVLRLRRFVFLDRLHDARALADLLGLAPGARFTHNPAFGVAG